MTHHQFNKVLLSCLMGLGFLGVSHLASAQVGFPPPPPKVSPAAGVIDMHVHPDPDVFGRSLTDIELAMIARRKGMRGIVIKNHVVTTADRAALVMQQVPGIEVWGGIVLNKWYGCLHLILINTLRHWLIKIKPDLLWRPMAMSLQKWMKY